MHENHMNGAHKRATFRWPTGRRSQVIIRAKRLGHSTLWRCIIVYCKNQVLQTTINCFAWLSGQHPHTLPALTPRPRRPGLRHRLPPPRRRCRRRRPAALTPAALAPAVTMLSEEGVEVGWVSGRAGPERTGSGVMGGDRGPGWAEDGRTLRRSAAAPTSDMDLARVTLQPGFSIQCVQCQDIRVRSLARARARAQTHTQSPVFSILLTLFSPFFSQ